MSPTFPFPQSLYLLIYELEWKDDLPQPPPSPSQPRFSVPPSPSPSQRHRIELSRTPRKRGRSPTPPPLTPSQKRLANIQAALGTPTSTANKNKAEADDDALFSAFSSPPAIPDTPREPKRMRGYMPMTPPRDADGGHREGGGRGGAFPETPSKSKGKGRECAGMDDAENPFHAPTSPPGPDESQLPSVIAGVHLLPAYIAKLQRQKVAAERSSEAKERRIEELQGEVERCVFVFFPISLLASISRADSTQDDEQNTSAGGDYRGGESSTAPFVVDTFE